MFQNINEKKPKSKKVRPFWNVDFDQQNASSSIVLDDIVNERAANYSIANDWNSLSLKKDIDRK